MKLVGVGAALAPPMPFASPTIDGHTHNQKCIMPTRQRRRMQARNCELHATTFNGTISDKLTAMSGKVCGARLVEPVRVGAALELPGGAVRRERPAAKALVWRHHVNAALEPPLVPAGTIIDGVEKRGRGEKSFQCLSGGRTLMRSTRCVLRGMEGLADNRMAVAPFAALQPVSTSSAWIRSDATLATMHMQALPSISRADT